MAFWPTAYSASATGSVNFSSEVATTSGHRKLFHEVRKVSTPSVATAGPHSGRITEKKIRSSPAPSMRAAWISSSGRDRMNWRIRKTPNGPARNGRIIPGSVLVRPMLVVSTNSGTNVTTPGTISVPSTTANSTFLPGNCSLASA